MNNVSQDFSLIENAYINMAHTINSTASFDEITKSIINALRTIMMFINTNLPTNTNNYIVYNILLIAKLFIRSNKAKHCYCKTFIDLERLMNLLDNMQKSAEKSCESIPKR